MASPEVLPPSDAFEYEDSDGEEGVDQLYSESDNEADGAGKKPTSKRLRPFGQALLPQQKLENIIQNDGVTGGLALSKEALFLVSVATEEFVKKLAQAGCRQAHAERRVLINYRDMSLATQQYQEFMFLQDTIPTPMTLREALKLREAREADLLEDDPAMLGGPSVVASVAPSETASVAASDDNVSVSFSRPTRPKPVHANGRSNGSGSSLRPDRPELYPKRPTPLRESISASVSRTGSVEVQRAAEPTSTPAGDGHGNGNGRSSSISTTVANGETSTHASRSPTTTPATMRDEAQPSPRGFGQLLGPGQPPPLAGPASGFLAEANGPFVHAGSTIPGRTIYSQQRAPP
ncbi:hypothetical protein ONZ45_g4447 [Pleurotus djamor]|nr:hypothetical protein ONZ45_g4447 [Pleurotus djamor]